MAQVFSKSQFYMWRAVIAIAHADGEVQAEERAYLERILGNLDRVYGLSAEQKKTFAEDMEHPPKIEDMVKQIDEPQYRGMLITLGETIVWADGVVTEDEEAVLRKLRAEFLPENDATRLKLEMKYGASARRAELAAEKAAGKLPDDADRSPIMRGLGRLLDKLGIDL
jgi:uncharacterized membrane protein YebE (DUF533 family)